MSEQSGTPFLVNNLPSFPKDDFAGVARSPVRFPARALAIVTDRWQNCRCAWWMIEAQAPMSLGNIPIVSASHLADLGQRSLR